MDDLARTNSSSREVISTVSWTVLIAPFSLNILLAWGLSFISIFLVIFPILLMVYAYFINKSIELYLDEEGVWYFVGIFPWAQGVNGVKWRDLDEALIRMGFFSWALKSYTIVISHRYTKDNEIILNHMKDGDKAAALINERHRAMKDLT